MTHCLVPTLRRLACTAALLGLIAAAPQAAAQTLRFRISADPETLYNVNSISAIVDEVLGTYLLERLVYLDAEGRPQPWLAQSWQVSTDQKQVTFQLRQGVKFHDGSDFDAAAVKFHFDSILDPKNASPLRPTVGPLTSVDTPDAHTVRLNFSKPFGPLFSNLALGLMGINSPTAVRRYGKSYGRHPVGSGPYQLQRWTPGKELRLVRVTGYKPVRRDAVNPGEPRAEMVLLRVIREDAVASAALEAGELSAANLQPDTLPRFAKDPRFKVETRKEVKQLAFMEMNQQRPPLDEPAVRRALSLAIDRQAIVQGAFSGYATPMTVPLAPGIPGHDKALAAKAELGYDPAKAKALLAGAGWVLKDGQMQRQGKPLQLVLRGVSGSDAIDRALAIVQSNLKALGIASRIETADWGALYPGLLKPDWDLAVMGWTWPDGSVMGNLWKGTGHRQQLRPNAALDATFERCESSLEPASRISCLVQAQRQLIEQTVVLPLWSRWDQVAVQSGLRDYTIDASGYLIPGDVQVPK